MGEVANVGVSREEAKVNFEKQKKKLLSTESNYFCFLCFTFYGVTKYYFLIFAFQK